MSLLRSRSTLELRAIFAKGRARFGGAKQELAASTERGKELLAQRDQLIQQKLTAEQALAAARGALATERLGVRQTMAEKALEAAKAKAALKATQRQLATVDAMLAREGVRATIRPVAALVRKSSAEVQAEKVAAALTGQPGEGE